VDHPVLEIHRGHEPAGVRRQSRGHLIGDGSRHGVPELHRIPARPDIFPCDVQEHHRAPGDQRLDAYLSTGNPLFGEIPAAGQLFPGPQAARLPDRYHFRPDLAGIVGWPDQCDAEAALPVRRLHHAPAVIAAPEPVDRGRAVDDGPARLADIRDVRARPQFGLVPQDARGPEAGSRRIPFCRERRRRYHAVFSAWDHGPQPRRTGKGGREQFGISFVLDRPLEDPGDRGDRRAALQRTSRPSDFRLFYEDHLASREFPPGH
jgi:hypothetical protein